MSMIKIGMIGIAAVFLALLLKKEKGELALLVGIAASVLIFGSPVRLPATEKEFRFVIVTYLQKFCCFYLYM